MRHFSGPHALGQLAGFLSRQAVPSYKRQVERILNEVGSETVAQVHDMVGVYQSAMGQYPAWAPLAQATLDRKARYGLGKNGSADTPLYASGAFDNSVSYRIFKTKGVVVVGTHEDKMIVHEFGNARTPPRPVFGPAVHQIIPRMLPKIRKNAAAGLNGIVGSQY